MPLQALRPKLLGATPLALALALLLGARVDDAQALGLGRPQILSSLGRPLDVAIPLTLAEGEQLTDGCLRGEVSAGDARVPAGLLQLRVEGDPGQQRVRLQSLVRIEEPALRITLALGCPVRLTREFNAFVDPAPAPAPSPAPPPAPAAAPVAPPVTAPLLAAAPPPAPEPQVRVLPDSPAAPTLAPAQAAPAAKPRPRPVARPRPAPAAPRLVLEAPEVLVSAAPPRPAASAAQDMELTPELEATLAQPEQTVAQLRAELQARQAEAAASASAAVVPASAPALTPAPAPPPVALRSTRTSPYRDPMTWLMTLGLSLLAGAAAYHVSRWRDQRARRERAYWRALHAAETAEATARPGTGMAPPVKAAGAAALPDEGQHTITQPQPRPMPWAPQATPAAAPVPPPLLQTVPMAPFRAASPATAVSPVVADELLDLQQQLDFLQLLGQHDAAADLLAARIARGGSGVMPSLMLMELCQQRGEPAVFAELAAQLERQFGVLAPDWAHSLARGRTLDTCPSVIAHLQVVWDDPAEAMKMLQGLIASGGGPGVPSFDLPACRDLLLLYSVARDLYEAGLRGDGVDLMLPMDTQL